MNSNPRSDQFEQAFSDYLDSHTYDETEQALFALIRAAYAAGWDAGQRAGKKENLVLLPPPKSPRQP